MYNEADLADSDRLALVSEREAAELRVVDKALDAHGLRRLDQSDDLLALLRELWRLLRLATCRFVEVVQKGLARW